MRASTCAYLIDAGPQLVQRISFAAECAARCVWSYLSWARRKHPHYGVELQAICDELRNATRQGATDLHVLKRHLPAFDHLVQDDDQEYTAGADQAALAVLYALQCAVGGGSTRDALDAAEKAYSTRWIPITLGDDQVVVGDEIDRREEASSVLQAELAFQLELLTKLEAAG